MPSQLLFSVPISASAFGLLAILILSFRWGGDIYGKNPGYKRPWAAIPLNIVQTMSYFDCIPKELLIVGSDSVADLHWDRRIRRRCKTGSEYGSMPGTKGEGLNATYLKIILLRGWTLPLHEERWGQTWVRSWSLIVYLAHKAPASRAVIFWIARVQER